MYSENKTTPHERTSKGQINIPVRQQPKKSGGMKAMTAITSALVLALVVTGLLLHTSMQSNAHKGAHIEDLRRHSTPVTHQQQDPPTTQQPVIANEVKQPHKSTDCGPCKPCPPPTQPTNSDDGVVADCEPCEPTTPQPQELLMVDKS